MKTSRRNFLGMIGAALAVVFVPKPKDVEVEPSVTIYDMLDDFNETITANADAPKGDPVDTEVEKPDFLDLLEDVYNHVRDKKELTAAITPYRIQGRRRQRARHTGFEPPLEKCPNCGGDEWEYGGEAGFVRCASCLEPHALNNRTELLKEFVWTSGSIESGATAYLSHDNGDTWEHVGEIA